jgi:hypothetical protein
MFGAAFFSGDARRAVPFAAGGILSLAAAVFAGRDWTRAHRAVLDRVRSGIRACLDGQEASARDRRAGGADPREDPFLATAGFSELLARVRGDREWISAQKEAVRMETKRILPRLSSAKIRRSS